MEDETAGEAVDDAGLDDQPTEHDGEGRGIVRGPHGAADDAPDADAENAAGSRAPDRRDGDREQGAADSGEDGGDHSTDKDARRDRRPSRRALLLVAVPLVALFAAANVGDAIAPALIPDQAIWLITLNARNRNLVLATNELNAWAYYGIGSIRQFVADPLFFLLGYWYGDAAVRWMERRTRTWGTLMRQVERGFSKVGYPVIFFIPNNLFNLLAGASGMPLRAFVAVNLAGTFTRLYLIRRFGEIFDSPIDSFTSWIGDNRVPLLIITVSLVLLSLAMEWKRGGPDPGLTKLEEEVRREGGTTDDAEQAPTDRSEPADDPGSPSRDSG